MASPEWAREFEAYAERMLGVYQAPGLALGLARDGRPLYEHGFGYRDREQGLPATSHTVFGIGSITKSFTCVALMQLQEAGRLSINDSVVRYLPEFRTPDPSATAAITIRHFMTHTSGLPPLPFLFRALARSMAGDPSVPPRAAETAASGGPIDTPAQLLELIAEGDYELLGPPGQQFSYSNDAYALLGLIIERVSGLSYPRYVSAHILEPAGMTSVTLDADEVLRMREPTTLYAVRPGLPPDAPEEIIAAPVWWQAPAMLAAGFIRASVHDMLRYMEIYRTGGRVGPERLLSEASVAEMTRPRAPCGPGLYYGYGLMITPDYHGVALVEHGGGIKGVSAHVTAVPSRGLTGAALCNLAGVPSGQILLGAINGELGVPISTRRVEFGPYESPVDLAEYVGTYHSGEGAGLEVSSEGGALTFEAEGRRLSARPVDTDAFVVRMREDEAYAQFLRNQAGDVHALAFGFRIVRRVKPAANSASN